MNDTPRNNPVSTFLAFYSAFATLGLIYVLSTFTASATLVHSTPEGPHNVKKAAANTQSGSGIQAPAGSGLIATAASETAESAGCSTSNGFPGNDPAVDADMHEQQIAIDLYQYSRVVQLTADQKSRIAALMRLSLSYNGPYPEDPDAPSPTDVYQKQIDTIVGEKGVAALSELQNEETQRDNLQRSEAQASYIARALGLPESKFEQLVNSLGVDNRDVEEEISYRTRMLRLSAEQESRLRDVWNTADGDALDNFIEERGGRETLDQSYYSFASSDHSPDWDKVKKLYVSTQLREVLSDAQYQQLVKLDRLGEAAN